MPLIVICGGGGKTTLIKKYPDLFLDIDDFVWSSYNTEYHDNLSDAIALEDVNAITNIYKTIMVNNREHLQGQSKIILGHDPIYAEWIGIDQFYSQLERTGPCLGRCDSRRHAHALAPGTDDGAGSLIWIFADGDCNRHRG